MSRPVGMERPPAGLRSRDGGVAGVLSRTPILV